MQKIKSSVILAFNIWSFHPVLALRSCIVSEQSPDLLIPEVSLIDPSGEASVFEAQSIVFEGFRDIHGSKTLCM
jgi:hypothetical protein